MKKFGVQFGSIALVTVSILQLPAAASQRQHSTLSQAGHIATQPGRDVGIGERRVPRVLKRALANPYSVARTRTCARIRAEVDKLDDALGPDFGHKTTRRGSRVGTIAKQGGASVINSLIPFRGLVREVSGAAAADRRFAAAVNAGYARRGFLRGVYIARKCRPAL